MHGSKLPKKDMGKTGNHTCSFEREKGRTVAPDIIYIMILRYSRVNGTVGQAYSREAKNIAKHKTHTSSTVDLDLLKIIT